MSNITNRNSNRAFVGLMFLVIGAGLLLRNMDFPFFPHWLFQWPMILILIGFYSGVKNNFRNNAWIILIVLGGFFLADDFIPNVTKEVFFWPVAIMFVGVVFILRPHRNDCVNDLRKKKPLTGPEPTSYDQSGFKVVSDSQEDISDNYLTISSIFSGVNRKILSKNFQGGSINCIFGGAEIDMTQADFHGRVVIRVDQVFGGIKLKVPPDWIVQNDVTGVFHGVDEKRNPQSFAANPDKTLVLKGSSIFAGIEIRSY